MRHSRVTDFTPTIVALWWGDERMGGFEWIHTVEGIVAEMQRQDEAYYREMADDLHAAASAAERS